MIIVVEHHTTCRHVGFILRSWLFVLFSSFFFFYSFSFLFFSLSRGSSARRRPLVVRARGDAVATGIVWVRGTRKRGQNVLEGSVAAPPDEVYAPPRCKSFSNGSRTPVQKATPTGDRQLYLLELPGRTKSQYYSKSRSRRSRVLIP